MGDLTNRRYTRDSLSIVPNDNQRRLELGYEYKLIHWYRAPGKANNLNAETIGYYETERKAKAALRRKAIPE